MRPIQQPETIATDGIELTVGPVQGDRRWDDQASALNAPLFHSAAWGRYRVRQGTRQLLTFQWRVDNAERPSAVALGRVTPVAPRLRDVACRVEFDSPPAGSVRQADLLAPVVRWAKDKLSVVDLRLGSFDPRGRWRDDAVPTPSERIEFVVEPGSRDELVRAMRKGARSSIKRAERFSVVTRLGDAADVEAFAALQMETLLRLNRQKGVPIGSVDTDAVIGLIRDGAGKLYVTEESGTIVVAWLFGVFDRAAYSLMGGNGERALEIGAVPFTLAHALADLSAAGMQQLNLGGVQASAQDPASPDHGLYAFKAGLGARPVPCTSGTVVCRPGRSAAIAVARRVARRRIVRAR